MQFRNTPVDGFFVVHAPAGQGEISKMIEYELNKRDAVMEDVQYSTHVEDDVLYNDVLVMYRRLK